MYLCVDYLTNIYTPMYLGDDYLTNTYLPMYIVVDYLTNTYLPMYLCVAYLTSTYLPMYIGVDYLTNTYLPIYLDVDYLTRTYLPICLGVRPEGRAGQGQVLVLPGLLPREELAPCQDYSRFVFLIYLLPHSVQPSLLKYFMHAAFLKHKLPFSPLHLYLI